MSCLTTTTLNLDAFWQFKYLLGFGPRGVCPKARSGAPETKDAVGRRARGEGQRYARQASRTSIQGYGIKVIKFPQKFDNCRIFESLQSLLPTLAWIFDAQRVNTSSTRWAPNIQANVGSKDWSDVFQSLFGWIAQKEATVPIPACLAQFDWGVLARPAWVTVFSPQNAHSATNITYSK